jgi:hypothetical protein
VWTVIFIAPDEENAESVKGLLNAEGIMVMLRPIGELESSPEKKPVEVLVPECEAEEAAEILVARSCR